MKRKIEYYLCVLDNIEINLAGLIFMIAYIITAVLLSISLAVIKFQDREIEELKKQIPGYEELQEEESEI